MRHSTSRSLLIFITLLETSTPEIVSCQLGTPIDFLIFNRSLAIAQQKTPPMIFSVEKKKTFI